MFSLELLIPHHWHKSLLPDALWVVRFSNLADGNRHCCWISSDACAQQCPAKYWRECFAGVRALSLWGCLLSGFLWTLPTLVFPGPQLFSGCPQVPCRSHAMARKHWRQYTGPSQGSSPLFSVSWETILCCLWFSILKTIGSYIWSSLLGWFRHEGTSGFSYSILAASKAQMSYVFSRYFSWYPWLGPLCLCVILLVVQI